MKSTLTLIAASSLLAAVAIAQPRPGYTITDLGAVGGTPGEPYIVTNNGLVAGSAASGVALHAVLWYRGVKIDIGLPGLKGPNSQALNVNESGQAVGQAETSAYDNEDFCAFNFYGFPSLTKCRPFVWQIGGMTMLPTLGGANGFANGINNRGEVVGISETGNNDPNPACPVAQFAPVIWKSGIPKPLETYAGDPDGIAAAINDNGQAVGASGTCSSINPATGLYLVEDHALLWERDGTVHDLGNLGGSGGLAGKHACALNNKGQVVGHSQLPNNTTFHGFLWTKEKGMRDLGTVAGAFDYASLALGVNNAGDIVGASLDANFHAIAALWADNGVAVDLNALIASNPGNLTLIQANSINSRGEITGLALTSSGEPHGFLAIPTHP
jgi:probable HAF family extracellular repeat protein